MALIEDLISVVVPIYNRENYLHEAMESIINQTYKNLEIILVDDGSTDRSLSICKYYEKLDSRVKVLTQRNKGISMAMKYALSICSGKYITRCDSDDINKLCRYEKQLMYLKENNYDYIGSYLEIFGKIDEEYKKNTEEFLNLPIRKYEDEMMILSIGSTIGGGVFFSKTSVLKKIAPFHKDYGIVEDVYMYVNLHNNKCKIGMLEEPLYYYRMHDSNTSVGSNRENVVKKHLYVLFKYFYLNKIKSYRNIIVIKGEKEEKILRNILKKELKKHKVTFISESKIDRFLTKDIYNYKPNETILLIGITFKDKIMELMKSKKYKLYKNMFYVADFYY